VISKSHNAKIPQNTFAVAWATLVLPIPDRQKFLQYTGEAWFWHKMPGQDPGDQCPCEIIWLSTPGPPAVIPHKWRGGMREGEENWVHLHDKLHPAQKPIAVMTYLVQQTTAPIVIDPFMGSGTTLAACVRLGRPCIGAEVDPACFAVACARLQHEVAPAQPHLRSGRRAHA
jgi:hypothetical protein